MTATAAPERESWLPRLDRWLALLGDRLNPILVKETRQALKSRQFVLTFGAVLLCVWLWTVFGITLIGPDVGYLNSGPSMFAGYFVILAFPLWVVVPFGAFRSLASEREDHTYELISITTLSPRQIISGKLGSAIVQMVIYLSSITPCLAFTYMLRGVDFPSILMWIAYTVLISLALSMLALTVASLTTERMWQMLLTVAVLVGLIAAFIGFLSFFSEVGDVALPVAEKEFWIGNACFLSIYLSYFLLVYYAAAAAITFRAENRATRLRAAMVGQQMLIFGWVAALLATEATVASDFAIFLASYFGVQWFVFGSLMVGESPDLSPRVKRALPRSWLGRVLLSWFQPGPGAGYVFTLLSMLAAIASIVACFLFRDAIQGGRLIGRIFDQDLIIAFMFMVWCYMAIFLGLGALTLRGLRRFGRTSIALPVLIQFLFLLFGFLIEMVARYYDTSRIQQDFIFADLGNPFMSLAYLADKGSLPAEAPQMLLIVGGAALLVLAVNFPGVVREIAQVRMAAPQRVVDDEEALHPRRALPPQPLSPWD